MSKVDLLPHNQETFNEICEKIESGITKLAIPHATGSGKTYLMGALAEQYNDDKKLVLEPRRQLRDDIKKKFGEFGIVNTEFITYQKLIRMSDKDIANASYKVIFLDECHHGTTPVWGQKIDCLINTHPESIILGTSATTVRNDGVDVVESLFNNNTTKELSLATAIAKKILPCPHYVGAIYNLDEELERLKNKVDNATNTKEEKRELYLKIKSMQSHFEKSYGIPTILNKYIKVKNGKYLVFCKDKNHLENMRDVVVGWFKTAGIKNIHSYSVYSKYQNKERDYNDFCNDNSNALKILFSINMLNEGIHIKNISGLIMLRSTGSNLVYFQQLGRLIGSDNIDKYLVVFDFVNNFSSVNDGMRLLKDIKNIIAKENSDNFNDDMLNDIDTFFIIEQVQKIQTIFNEIESKINSKHVSFSSYEDDIIKKYFPLGGSAECLKYIKNKDRRQIVYRARCLGIKYYIDRSKKWTDEKIQYLLLSYENTDISLDEMSSYLGFTKMQIRAKASRLGLLRRKLSKHDEQFIKDNYAKYGAEYVSKKIKRNIQCVYAYASLHGIKGKRPNAVFTEYDDKIIEKYYPEMGSDCVIYLKNKDKQQIAARAAKLKVRFLQNQKTNGLFYQRCNEIKNAQEKRDKDNYNIDL